MSESNTHDEVAVGMSNELESGSASSQPGVVVIVMGVSGCGKSTITRLLAERLGGYWKDGDELHPPRNIALMAGGTPLTDDDRAPWLAAVRDHARDMSARHGIAVVACSSLKRRYRDVLTQAGQVFFVFLDGSRELIAGRMHERSGHFMPDSLLDSQYAALESPEGERMTVTIDIAPSPDVIAANAERALRDHPEFRVPSRMPS